MPASFRIDALSHVVHSRAWGVLTDHDLKSNRESLVRDPAFDPASSQLYDFSEVTALEVTSAGVRGLAQTSPFASTARRAIVVSSDAAYGMARMFAFLGNRDQESFQIFRSLPEALEWLNPVDGPVRPEVDPAAPTSGAEPPKN